MNLLKLSWKYIIAKPLASTLSIVLVALGVSLTSILFLLNKQFQDRLYNNIDGIDLVVGAKGSPLQMILSSVYQIQAPTGNIPLKESFVVTKNPFVEKAIPLAMGDSYKGYRIVGTDSQYVAHFKADVAMGRHFKNDLEVTVGSRCAEKLGLKLGDTFYGSHGVDDGGHVHETYAYEVVGILQECNKVIDQLILTNVASVWRMHEDHDHDHSHGEEGHDHGHDHGAHDHGNEAHNHDGHDHGAHDHGNEAHNHDGHDHGAHDHGNEAHNHDGHDHGAHDHGNAAHNHDGHDHSAHDHGNEAHNHDGHDHDAHDHDAHDHGHGHAHHDHGHSHTKKTKTPLPPISAEGKSITSYLVQYKKDKQGNSSARAFVECSKIIDEYSQSMGYAKPSIQLQSLLDLTGVGIDFLRGLALIIVLISAFSMFISLYSSLKDRQYEMALMRVGGASRSKLFLMIILEGLMIAIGGLLLGLLISHLGMQMMAGNLEESYKYTFTGWLFLIEEFYLCVGAILIGFLAAFVPAIQAYNTDISTTLSNG